MRYYTKRGRRVKRLKIALQLKRPATSSHLQQPPRIPFENRRALGRAGDLGQALVPEDAAVEIFHHVKGAADNAVVLAQEAGTAW